EEGGGGRRLQRLGAPPRALAARAHRWELERLQGGTEPQLAPGRRALPAAARASWSGDARRHAHRREAPRSLRPGALRLRGPAEVGDPVAARDGRVLRPGRPLGGQAGLAAADVPASRRSRDRGPYRDRGGWCVLPAQGRLRTLHARLLTREAPDPSDAEAGIRDRPPAL